MFADANSKSLFKELKTTMKEVESSWRLVKKPTCKLDLRVALVRREKLK
jgi:hypothetical protein